MKKLIIAAVAMTALPQVAAAQNLPAPVIAVVDANRAASECNACRTAVTQLQQQAQGVQALRTQLSTPLQTEGQQLETAVRALAGKQPDAALTKRINDFRTKQQQAEQQIAGRVQTLERNQAYAVQQINTRLGPAIEAVQGRRRATVVLDTGSVLKFSPSIDVTADVIAELNRTLTSVATTAPAQTQQQNPQGR
jgi:Skp family chaperone for outer membrane proteins